MNGFSNVRKPLWGLFTVYELFDEGEDRSTECDVEETYGELMMVVLLHNLLFLFDIKRFIPNAQEESKMPKEEEIVTSIIASRK